MAEEKEIGKIGVAVIELSDELKVGEQIKIKGGNRDFTQIVTSMQIEHKNVDSAGKNEAVGLKVDQPVREGDKVYKIVE